MTQKGFLCFPGVKKYKSTLAKSLKVVSETHLYYVRLKSSNWLIVNGKKMKKIAASVSDIYAQPTNIFAVALRKS